MALTAKQLAFCREYLVDLNATRAYARAGYRAAGNAAETNASRLLRSPGVAAEVGRLLADRAARTALTADGVIRRLAEEADYRGDGSTHSARVRALEVLARHHGLLRDRVEVKGTARLEVVEEVVDARPDLSALTDDQLRRLAAALGSPPGTPPADPVAVT